MKPITPNMRTLAGIIGGMIRSRPAHRETLDRLAGRIVATFNFDPKAFYDIIDAAHQLDTIPR